MIQFDTRAIRSQMVDSFNLNEMKDLYFELYVDWEDIDSSDTKSARSRELISYLERRSRLPELVFQLQEIRPDKEWNLMLSQRQRNRAFKRDLGLDSSVSNEKFERYMLVWEKLDGLDEAGEALWERASQENIFNFANLLRQTESLIKLNKELFDYEDYDNLRQILNKLGQFEAGKIKLREIREIRQLSNDNYSQLSEYKLKDYGVTGVKIQIRQNERIKYEYSQLLRRIRLSFRRKIMNLRS